MAEDQQEVQFVYLDNLGNGAARDGETPQCALFEADGGAWKIKAIEAIRGWLKSDLKTKAQIIA